MRKKIEFKILFFGYVIFLFLSLPFAGPFARYLRKEVFGPDLMGKIVIIFLFIVFLITLFFIFKNKGFKKFLISFLILLFLFIFSFYVKTPEEKLHLFEYFLLGILCYKSFKNPFLIIFLIFTIALADEFVQYLLPMRYGDLKDVLSNIIGGGAGFLICIVFKK